MKKTKIVDLNFLKSLQKSKNKIGLCHGVFDIIHKGHLQHLKFAKSKVDILVVSITSDKFVNKAPHLPINNQKYRANFLTFLDFIDYVYINNKETSENIIKILKPKVYFKGSDYKKKDITGNLQKEIKLIKKNNGKIMFSNTPLMSSSKITNNSLYEWAPLQKKILRNLSKKNGYEKIDHYLNNIKKIDVTIIGEPIIDKYVFGKMYGLTSKDPAISLIKESQISIAGGVLAVAKILANFTRSVTLYSYGPVKGLKKTFKKYKNVKIVNLSNSIKIQEKTRYLNSTRYEKIMQITKFKKNQFAKNVIKKIKQKIKKIKTNNLVICDYGIDLFDKEIISLINKVRSKKYLNVQTNSLNLGFNLFTKYNKYNYLSLDEREWQLGLNYHSDMINNISKLSFKKNALLSLTKSKDGSNLIYKNENHHCPTFINKTVDTTGCGDAYFAITSIFIMVNAPRTLLPFVGNAYAGLHSQFFGNDRIVGRIKFLKYIKTLLNF
jgi:rfaE bifunctional protein nucleotidyltransferase chain/domain